MKQGLVHAFYGDGEGKTTASIGLAVRCAGAGNTVLIVQFFKGSPSGEVGVLESLEGIEVLRAEAALKFTWEMTEEELAAQKRKEEALFKTAWQKAVEEGFDMLVLDEVLDIPYAGVIEEEHLLQALATKPEGLEVVMTGHHFSEALKEKTDYVTHMEKIKHPYDKGIKARKGIEF